MNSLLIFIMTTFSLGFAHAQSSYICDHKTGSNVFSQLKLKLTFDENLQSVSIRVLREGRASGFSPRKSESPSVLKYQYSKLGYRRFETPMTRDQYPTSSSRAYTFNIDENSINASKFELSLAISPIGSFHTYSGFGMTCSKN